MASAQATAAPSARAAGAGLVLMTLAAGQFLMTLDSSVMNVSIATVAKDVGTTVTGIQGAITAYTLVMAALMITRGQIGGLDCPDGTVAQGGAAYRLSAHLPPHPPEPAQPLVAP